MWIFIFAFVYTPNTDVQPVVSYVHQYETKQECIDHMKNVASTEQYWGAVISEYAFTDDHEAIYLEGPDNFNQSVTCMKRNN